jgi:diguanylate cyclase (GGDEF)-like protein
VGRLNDDPAELRRRIAALEAELRERTEEVGYYRLQLDILSTIDPVTGLLNRSGLVDSLDVALHRLERQREPFAVLAVRLAILGELALQDNEAHEEALRHCSTLLSAGLRALDRNGRVDSSTFAVVLPLVIEADVPLVVGRLMSILTAAPLEVLGTEVDPDPRFSVVLVGSGQVAEIETVLDLVEQGLSEATAERPSVKRI